MVTAAVEISESIQQGIDDLIGFLPRLIGFLLILLVGYLVAKALGRSSRWRSRRSAPIARWNQAPAGPMCSAWCQTCRRPI